ncbi:MAG: hypothetical protein P9L94_20360 [Candidatus Hinthialibacter antarcticus]|nr:hypothetical protein [Candidatus Hinthialibacter antarcticus]
MQLKRTHSTSQSVASSASSPIQTPRLKDGSGSGSDKPRTLQEKKAALRKYLASLEPEKRKKVIAALAKKQKEKRSQKPKPDADEAPSTTSDPLEDAPSAPTPPPGPSRARPARSSRTPSTKILSKVQYRKASGIMLKRRVIQIMCLFFFLALGAGWVAFIGYDQSSVMIIMDASAKGLGALEDDKFDEAASHFQIVLDVFTEYNKTKNAWWRRPDVQLVPQLLRVAIGWRVLGKTGNAVELFHQTALYLPEGLESWQGDEFKKQFEELLNPDYWSEPDAAELYTLLVAADPASWGEAGNYLVENTERVGFWLAPLWRRYQDAEIIVYGNPRSVSDGKDGEFVVDAEIIYKADREPGLFYFQPVEEMTPIERKRLDWYLASEEKCILFGTMDGDKGRLNSIEGVVISRPSTVDEFNGIVVYSN